MEFLIVVLVALLGAVICLLVALCERAKVLEELLQDTNRQLAERLPYCKDIADQFCDLSDIKRMLLSLNGELRSISEIQGTMLRIEVIKAEIPEWDKDRLAKEINEEVLVCHASK